MPEKHRKMAQTRMLFRMSKMNLIRQRRKQPGARQPQTGIVFRINNIENQHAFSRGRYYCLVISIAKGLEAAREPHRAIPIRAADHTPGTAAKMAQTRMLFRMSK